MDMAREAVSNWMSAHSLAEEERWDRDPDLGAVTGFIDFTVWSETKTGLKYTVRLNKDALSYNAMEQIHVRKLIKCGCPGYNMCEYNGRVCKHCGCILIVLARHNRECERIAYQKFRDDPSSRGSTPIHRLGLTDSERAVRAAMKPAPSEEFYGRPPYTKAAREIHDEWSVEVENLEKARAKAIEGGALAAARARVCELEAEVSQLRGKSSTSGSGSVWDIVSSGLFQHYEKDVPPVPGSETRDVEQKPDNTFVRLKEKSQSSMESAGPAYVRPGPCPAEGFVFPSPLMIGYNQDKPKSAKLIDEGGGNLRSLLNSDQTFDVMLHMIGAAREKIMMTAFTLDNTDIATALAAAVVRKVKVTLIVDLKQTVAGSCKDQLWVVKKLTRDGVTVFLSEGMPIAGPYQEAGRQVSNLEKKGIQHSKTLLCDDHLILGSCNFTTSSRANHELNVLLQLDPIGLALRESEFEELKRVSNGPLEDREKAFHSFGRYKEYFDNQIGDRQKDLDARRYSIANESRRQASRAASADRLGFNRSRDSEASM